VQLIIAGKAHPADQAGQNMIRGWTQFARRPEVRQHVVFLSDYDMLLTGQLVQGVDVWINTPRRPWEACGTSGMKVLVNGGLNLSELDGWWAEAYTPEVGWALGDSREHGDDPSWDTAEAEALYSLLEREVIPEFYARDANGIPLAWVVRIRESMGRLTPRFSANRTVREYTEKYYIPASAAYRERATDGGAMAVRLLDWRRALEEDWPNLRFGEVKVLSDGGKHVFEVQVHLGGLDPDTIRVELYADKEKDGEPVRQEMIRGRQLPSPEGYISYSYNGEVPSVRPATDYTPRIIPRFPGASIPLEAPRVLWQR
jgi:starch phosphorylase